MCVIRLRIKNFDQMHIGQFHINRAQLILIPKNTNKYVIHNLGYKGDLSTMFLGNLANICVISARWRQDLFGASLPYSLETLGNLGIFANFWKSSEHHWQGSNFSDGQVIWMQKSQACDLAKVGS